MIVSWLQRLPRYQKGKYIPSHGLWAACFHPLHPPVLPLTGHSLRHVSSALENEAHRFCLNHSTGRPAWGTAPACYPASGRWTSFAKTEQNSLGPTDKPDCAWFPDCFDYCCLQKGEGQDEPK